MSLIKAGALSASVVCLTKVALAQGVVMHAHDTGLPAACQNQVHDMDAVEDAPDASAGMTEFQSRMMEGMARSGREMMQGVMSDDADIAFACAMIPHHRAAIDMAKIELEFGDSGPMQEMAGKIIAAQEQEIAELTAWIESRAR